MKPKRPITKRDDIYLKIGRWPSENPRPRCPYCLRAPSLQIARVDNGPKALIRNEIVGHWCPKCRTFFYLGGTHEKVFKK